MNLFFEITSQSHNKKKVDDIYSIFPVKKLGLFYPLLPSARALLTVLLLISLFTVNLTFANSLTETTGTIKLKADLEAGKKTYELCATCHYANGWGKEDGSFPVIAAQHKSVIIKQLADIRARNRENPTMYPFSGDDILGGAQGIEDVAGYIAILPANPNPGKGDGKHLKRGKKIYLKKCSNCHGKKGKGNAKTFFPRIQGQHYAYILRQLQWIRDGRRKNANIAMLARIKDMDDETLSAVADYVSHIKVKTKKKKSKSEQKDK